MTSPEQGPIHALYSLGNEFCVTPCLDVQANNRFGVRTAQIKAPIAHVEAQAVHLVYG